MGPVLSSDNHTCEAFPGPEADPVKGFEGLRKAGRPGTWWHLQRRRHITRLWAQGAKDLGSSDP